MSSYPRLNRPANPAHVRVETIEELELLDAVDDDVSGFATRPEEPHWFVQMSPGEVKELSAEQLRDFYRLGVISRETYICQPGMKEWLQVGSFIGASQAQQPDDHWQVAMGPGDVRTVSLDQLDDFYRLGVVDGQTFVWQQGMAGWAQLSTLIGEEPDDADEDTWYAAVEPGSIKQLTLEQLDDYFRCDIINEQTPIWKEGMTQWLPLGTVAGIEAPARAAVQPAARPQTQPAPAARSQAPQAQAAQVSTVKSVVPAYTMPLTTSAPPLAVSIAPAATKSAGERWLLRLAIGAAALLTLQRHDVLFSWAQASKQQGPYVDLERQLFGGPPFGTPRAVEQIVASAGELAPVRLPWLVQEAHEHALHATASAHAAAATLPVAAATEPVAAHPVAAAAEHTAQVKPESPTPVAHSLSTMATPKKLVAVKSTPRAPKKSASKSKSVFNAKGDRNDPLNAAL